MNGQVVLLVTISQRFLKRKSAAWNSRYAPLYRGQRTAKLHWKNGCLLGLAYCLKRIHDRVRLQIDFTHLIEGALQIGMHVTQQI